MMNGPRKPARRSVRLAREMQLPPIHLQYRCVLLPVLDASLDNEGATDMAASLFVSGSFPATVLASFVATREASELASVPSGLVWHLAGSSWPATTRSVEQAGVPTGWFSTWDSSVRASKRASVSGTVPLDDSMRRRTWSTVGEIMGPNEIILNLKINTEKLSSTLANLAEKFSTEMTAAMDAAMLSITNFGKTVRDVPVGVLRSVPISFSVTFDDSRRDSIVGFDVGDRRGSKPIVGSGQVGYASVVHETFSKLQLDKVAADWLNRYR